MLTLASFKLENSLWRLGKTLVCGIDEVGRGCFAGPVVAAGVIFPVNFKTDLPLADSKLLNKQKREELATKIMELALAFSVAEVEVEMINKFGIGRATQMAFLKVVKGLNPTPDYVLIDAFHIKNLDLDIQKAIPKGDRDCASIAAASIIAKVYRDGRMSKLSKQYPEYNFSKNKGYGTKEHREAIKKYGLCQLHRSSFNLEKFLK